MQKQPSEAYFPEFSLFVDVSEKKVPFLFMLLSVFEHETEVLYHGRY